MVGKWLKVAWVHDEFFVEGEIVPEPQQFIAEVQQWSVKPDLFTFAQKVNDLTPRFRFTSNGKILPLFRSLRTNDWFKNQIRKGTE